MKIFVHTMILGASLFILASCDRGEIPVPLHDAGNVITASVDLEGNYKWQIYYDLERNRIVRKIAKTSWDLGFECGADGFHVILNTAKSMFSFKTQQTDFSTVTDTSGFTLGKKWDAPSGNLDSTAIGNWQESTNAVYIIDRGYTELGTHLGFKKITFQSVNASEYSVKYANLNGSGEVILQLSKNSDYNFSFLSFDNGTVEVEPPKAEWDLCFTQYLHVFYNPTTPYLVTGCLHNRYRTTVAKNNTFLFSELNYAQVNEFFFSSHINTIGYDWKSFTGSTYTTNPLINYILKNRSDNYYKLHFIDFYNSSGIKGSPTWEYQLL